MNNRIFLVMAVPASAVPLAERDPLGPPALPFESMEILVDVSHDLRAHQHIDVIAVTDTGDELFAVALPTSSGFARAQSRGQTGISFPRWVRVTWRARGDSSAKGRTTGRVFGDHQVDVLNRIPTGVLAYAAGGARRALMMKFRITDDCVMFAWSVQERRLSDGAVVYKLAEGDF
jgi:hypothetical protein